MIALELAGVCTVHGDEPSTEDERGLDLEENPATSVPAPSRPRSESAAPATCIPLELPSGREPIPALAAHEDEGARRGRPGGEALRPWLPAPCPGPSQAQTRPGNNQLPLGPGSWSQRPWVFCQFGEASDEVDPGRYFWVIKEKQNTPSHPASLKLTCDLQVTSCYALYRAGGI